MTKTVRDTASVAEDSFHKHYAAIWGEQRWASLYQALALPTRHSALVNRYTPAQDFLESVDDAGLPAEQAQGSVQGRGLQRLSFPTPRASEDVAHSDDNVLPDRTIVLKAFSPPRPSPSHPAHLMTHWNLDAASVILAHLLQVKPGDTVLDLCCAPGGKAIALSQTLWPEHFADSPSPLPARASRLVCNEADPKRYKRLIENLQSYLPPQLFKAGSVVTTKIDATSPSPALGTGFDKVLVDAPCSSERHVIHASVKAESAGTVAPEMANWRASSSKRLARTQLDLLMTALRAVKVGGHVTYATCSISPTENDGVIEKMLALVEKERRKGQRWSVGLGFDDDEALVEALGQWAEPTKYGWIVLPDHPRGGRWGPLFFAMMKKIDGR
ncbi:hypothetical protein LTR53_002949 [Teratosphaeriaceae sp. CCFEE 6253]|nr:hypothetical protein LTR53_002949 [Teratosphaeriaceae sp. CCFEE 6253]